MGGSRRAEQTPYRGWGQGLAQTLGRFPPPQPGQTLHTAFVGWRPGRASTPADPPAPLSPGKDEAGTQREPGSDASS